VRDKMNFAIANANVAVVGGSLIAENLREILQSIRTMDSNADLVFEFVDELPNWLGQRYVALDNYMIGGDRFRATEKLFCYELRLSEHPMRALVARRKTGLPKRVHRAIKKSWRYFHTHGSKAYLHPLKRFIFYVYMPLVELVLLRNGSSLAHCSAVEKEGRAVLFPAWGGIGKTGLMSRYIDDGWDFLSDDSCAIAADGTAYIHPLPMHIYGYHEVQSGELVKKMLSQTNAFDKLLWRFLAQVKKPDKLVRWVRADRVFGKDKIGTEGRITDVIHMHRYMQCSTFELKSAQPVEVAELMTSTILDEINNLANMAIVLHSCQPVSSLVPDIADLHRRIADVYSSAFSKANSYTLAVPEQATAEDIYRFIRDKKLL